ncbi:TIGR01777 family protein [Anaplasmataceae bacterium AB001_6]|nr:TIGR01777 family protein [Anaplasmataceae bacterium AB001_6]
MKILISGGTGAIGSMLTEMFTSMGHDIIILTRQKNFNAHIHNIVYINNLNDISNETEIDCIINLSGAPISKRWSKSYKRELLSSRIPVTQDLINLCQRLTMRVSIFISASAVGYYGICDDTMLDEESKYQKDCFQHTLCANWESVAFKAQDYVERLCIFRMGAVLHKDIGILQKLHLPFSTGFACKMGRGNQYFSWIHYKDLINIFDFVIKNDVSGIINVTAPNPVTNIEFTKILGKSLNSKINFTIPDVAINLLFGQMGREILLSGNRVIPKKIQKSGFGFKFQYLENAINDIYLK